MSGRPSGDDFLRGSEAGFQLGQRPGVRRSCLLGQLQVQLEYKVKGGGKSLA